MFISTSHHLPILIHYAVSVQVFLQDSSWGSGWGHKGSPWTCITAATSLLKCFVWSIRIWTVLCTWISPCKKLTCCLYILLVEKRNFAHKLFFLLIKLIMWITWTYVKVYFKFMPWNWSWLQVTWLQLTWRHVSNVIACEKELTVQENHIWEMKPYVHHVGGKNMKNPLWSL